MTFAEWANKFSDHEKFISANLECNADGDFSEDGTEVVDGMPEYMLTLTFVSGKTNIDLVFEGDDVADILEQADDHVNLILVTSTV